LIGKDPATTERFVRSYLGWMLAVAKRIVAATAIAEDVVSALLAAKTSRNQR